LFEITTFGVIEAALLRTYSVPRKAQGAFRGRLGNLQKHGLFGAKNMPGRGKALRYGPDQFHRLVFACELFEFGVAPSVVVDLVDSLWERRLRSIFKKAETAAQAQSDPGPNDVAMVMGGVKLMTDGWSNAIPNVTAHLLRELPLKLSSWMMMGSDDLAPPRVLVVNLSSRLRQFHTALAASYMTELSAERADIKKRKGKGPA
jgi:hypothetical protein